MPGPAGPSATETESAARIRGRGEGLAIAAVTLGAVAFINLLGAEKGILAIVFGVLAIRNVRSGPARRQGWIAIVLGAAQIATVVAVLVLFRDKLGQLLELLKSLG
jgi:hypothetical protein